MTAFRILAASDGSPSARAALRTALRFPWPEPSRAQGVVALGPGRPGAGKMLRAASVSALRAEVASLQRLLRVRWSDAAATGMPQAPVPAILGEARRFGADAIVLGWRGHGGLRRLLAGSVSRAVVARAPAAILVARRAPRALGRMVLGLDGSSSARRALRLASRFTPWQGASVKVVAVVEPLCTPPQSRRLPPSLHAAVRREVAAKNLEQMRLAKRRTAAAAALLERHGWAATPIARFGAPLETLLGVVKERDADLLVLGATRTGAIERALVGSVAAEALNRCPVPVLIVP